MASLRLSATTRVSQLPTIGLRAPRVPYRAFAAPHPSYLTQQWSLVSGAPYRRCYSASPKPNAETSARPDSKTSDADTARSGSDAASISSDSTSSTTSSSSSSSSSDTSASSVSSSSDPSSNDRDWEDYQYTEVSGFKDLPSRTFGVNQHMLINAELKAAFTQMLREFRAPIVFCFAYGSGVFPQGSSERSITDAEFRAVHPKPPEALMKTQRGNPKMVDFIFGVTHTEHWHWLNMRQHPDHYSGLSSLGSGAVSAVQEKIGAGVYFNPYVVVNGMLIKYGVTSISNLCHDLATWDTLYLAGRLHKPVKILRDNAAVRIANQQNLVGAVRTALLMLPDTFTELDLFSTIAAISYLGDPRMALPTENRNKVNNIVTNNLVNFRRLYAPLIEKLPNIDYVEGSYMGSADWLESTANHALRQDMDIVKRANMVRRLPSAFRSRLYFLYQAKFGMTGAEFQRLKEESADEDESGFKRRQGGQFEMRIAEDAPRELSDMVRKAIEKTVYWPSTTQSAKGLLTAGIPRTMRYMGEKLSRFREGKKKAETGAKAEESPASTSDQEKDQSEKSEEKKP